MRTAVSIFLLVICFLVPAAAEPGKRILVIGDSLSAAYGIDKHLGWVALLQKRLAKRGTAYQVVNASISGDTTRGGLTRLPAALERERPSVLIIALGGNDGLRGFDPSLMRENLTRMVDLGRAAGARVLLLGVRLPVNYGRTFGEKFHRVFLDLAAEQGVALAPFFLEGVAETRDLMQPDGIHPSAAAQPLILDNIWAVLAPLLRDG